MLTMTEQDKINNLSRFEHENDLILEVGTQLGILTEDYDVVNCVVTRIDKDVNKFWITRDGSTDEELSMRDSLSSFL